jgi:tetratricopeptide (TPR) repeat protein
LRIDLSQSQTVRLVGPDVVVRTLHRMELDPLTTALDERLAREVAEREGVKALLVGEVVPLGDGYVLSARVISPADGETLLARRATAADNSRLFDAINELSHELREGIGESLRLVNAAPPLARATTRSLEALRLYTIANRVDELAGDPQRAVALLERALTLDSTFALAWRRLGVVSANAGNPARGITARTRAYELRERLPLRERLLVEADYAAIRGDHLERMSAFEELLELYPDDWRALHNLADAYTMGEAQDYSRSVELFQRALDEFPNLITARDLVAEFIHTGRFDEAEVLARRRVDEFPDWGGDADSRRAWLTQQVGLIAYVRGDVDSMVAAFRAAGDLTSQPLEKAGAWRHVHYALAMQGKWAEADRWFSQAARIYAAEDPGAYLRIEAQEGLFDLVARGDAERGRRRVAASLERVPLQSVVALRRPYLELTSFYAEAGLLDRARASADAYASDADLPALEQSRRRSGYDRHLFRGIVALRAGELDEAIRALDRWIRLAAPFSPCSGALAYLGDALEQSGQADSAMVVYERFLASPEYSIDCRIVPDAIWRPAILTRLGRFYEQRGDRDKAIEHYNRFVDLWMGADAELQPQVDEVRQRIARLVGEPVAAAPGG